MLINFWVNVIKTISVTTCISFNIFKINNYKSISKNKMLMVALFNVMIAIIYAFMYQKFSSYNISSITNLLCYMLYSLIFIYIIKVPFFQGIILSVISITATFISKFLATIINFILIQFNVFSNEILEFISLAIIQFILLYLFFRIRRFKDGISFLKEGNYHKKIDDIGWIISILIIFSCTVLSTIKEYSIRTGIAMVLGIGGLLMINWVRKSITKHYKEKMRDRTVEIQAEQIKEKDEAINQLKEELANALKINHKYNHRISAMERLARKLNVNEEFANENSDIINSIIELSEEYKKELSAMEDINSLSKTGIISIDNLLEHMRIEAEKSDIELDIRIDCNLKEMLEKGIIKKNKLETLLADHIQDAIIAIKSGDTSYRNISVNISVKNEIYEISIYDSGIEFEIETLLELGLRNITTHKESGGTGIGFMTTFETLKDCNASIIIEEYSNTKNYTKSLNIKFDGKNEYKIQSYRANEIKSKNRNNRIIIEEL